MVLALWALLPAPAVAQIFGPATTLTAGQLTAKVRVVDIDGVLGPDIVVANRNDSTISFFAARGDGTFDAAVTLANATFPEELLAVDFDRDGDVDLIATDQGAGGGSPHLVVLENDGGGAFTTSIKNTLYFARALAFADFDRDGDIDLVSANENNDNVTLFLGNGSGSFTASADFSVGDNPVAVAAADLDGANGPDVVVAHVGSSDGVTVLLNNGGASFSSIVDYPVTTNGNPIEVVVVDLDGAFGPDLITANSLSGDLSVLIATGNGLFSAASSVAVPGGGFPASLAVFDGDDDGNKDVLVGQRTGRSVSAMLGDGSGGLVADAGSPYAVPLDVMAVAAADIDFDNDPDLVAATTDTSDPTLQGLVVLMRNQLGPFGPTVGTTSLPDGALAVAYSQVLTASGGVPPYTWDLAAGTLPGGLTLNPQTGAISGTPTFAAVGTTYFTARVRDAAFETGVRPLSIRVVSADTVLVAKGSGTSGLYDQVVKGYASDGTEVLTFATFALSGYGARVAGANLDGGALGEVLVTPGPGPNHQAAVRGYERDGTPIALVDFFAYGVLAYGAAAAGGDVDGLLDDEILTGPGPGPPFGPQVRGWAWDQATFPQPLSKVNFYAYSTLKYGTNVAAGDVDADGFAEILTGAGPGAVFGPHVRGFDYDGLGQTSALAKLSFFAYSTLKYGANAAAGELDADAATEILTGPGPGLVFGAHVRGFDYGAGVSPLPGLSAFLFTSRYGASVSGADVEPDGASEVLTGPGPDPSAAAVLAAYDYDGTALTPRPALSAIDPFPGLAYGLRVAGSPLGY